MKRFFFVFCLAFITLFAHGQGYRWFSKDKVPYYPKGRPAGFETFALTATGNQRNGYMPGYYITKEGEKIEGEVQYNFPYIMERLLVFIKDGKVTYINPKDVKGYFIDGIYRESVTVNVSMIASMKSLETYFMIPEIQGKLSLYYYTGETPSGLESNADLAIFGNYHSAYKHYLGEDESGIKLSPQTRYMVKEGEPGRNVDGMALTFVKQMPEVVADCPDLANKIKAKEKGYKSQNLEDIVKEYNQCVTK